MKTFRPDFCPVQKKFLATRRELSAALIERDEEIDIVLTALVCNEHPLLVGQPGTEKVFSSTRSCAGPAASASPPC